MFAKMLQRLWWIPLLRGVVAILFGLVALVMPGLALASLVLAFGLFLVVEGLFTIVHAIRGRKESSRWWLMFAEGMIAFALGLYVLRTPGIASLALLYFIAAWAVITGLMRLFLAIQLRKEIQGEWWLAMSGLVSMLFGLIMIARPAEGALALLWLIGLWSLLAGLALMMLAFKVRGFGKTLVAKASAAAGA